MKVVFVRHGESTGNAGLPSFELAKLELTEAGHAQVACVAAGWHAQPTLIAISPYLRTQLTARPTMMRFPTVPVEVLPMEEFTYLEPSRWNGTLRGERLPHIEAYWKEADPMYRDGLGAESFETLLGRVDLTLKKLEVLPAHSLVYAFSHGQFMQAVRISLLFPGWTSKQKMECFWPFNARYPVLNTDQLKIGFHGGLWSTSAV